MKVNVFKKGDVIVSGHGNVRIFTGELVADDIYECLTPYSESSYPTGTDMAYARPATAVEKKEFFKILKCNGLVYDANNCTIKATELYYGGMGILNYNVGKYEGPMMKYKIVAKRYRPTVGEINLLKSKIELLDECINTHRKENADLKAHLEDVKACNEKLTKELKASNDYKRKYDLADADLRAANDDCYKLTEEKQVLKGQITALEQSNRLIEDELVRLRTCISTLEGKNERLQAQIIHLEDRSLLDRIINRK